MLSIRELQAQNALLRMQHAAANIATAKDFVAALVEHENAVRTYTHAYADLRDEREAGREVTR